MPARATDNRIRVVEAAQPGFRQDIDIGGRHRLVADEPAELGGTDTGPTPGELLAAALGACTTITLRMYAERKRLALTRVSCEVRHDREPADADAPAGGAGAMVDVFERRITLDGTLDAADIDRLLSIAGKCPVHRTLTASARIRTALADADTTSD